MLVCLVSCLLVSLHVCLLYVFSCVSFYACLCVSVSLHVLFLLVFVCFRVLIELNLVTCLLFGRRMNFFLTLNLWPLFGILGYFLDLGLLCMISCE